jgi:hypothetical protein
MRPPYDISPRRCGAHEECELTLSLVLWHARAAIGFLVARSHSASSWVAGRASPRAVREVLIVSLAFLTLGSFGFVLGESLRVYFACRS